MKNPFHVMLIPTLGCPARCRYCWSSEPGSPRMSIATVRDVVEWVSSLGKERVTFTFHGGEPLLAGAAFYREALPLLAEGVAQANPEFAMQSNLWLMTPEIAEILAEYHVPIGTSIDGPARINDVQRGEGYFEKTMKGYRIAREHGLRVSFICTFTSQSFREKEEIVRFFRENGFTLKLHPALPSLRNDNPEPWTLSPDDYGDLLVYLLDVSLENLGSFEIMNINDLCKCVFFRHGTVCTFVDCMGSTFAVGPDGSIYPCYRFVGMPEYVMGHVSDCPLPEDLAASPIGEAMQEFRSFVDKACADCPHIRYCRGGCPYNAMVPGHGTIGGVDPYCRAYHRIFDEISGRLNSEMAEAPAMEMMCFGAPRQKQDKPGVMALMRFQAMKEGRRKR
ncbi:MAG TPA: TIGR04083 family peptide-modifying radical SAM enzyme [Methanolinea sp.]|nr:TIGR04083 family peptide-modifying radical SAM enzyme [Methanolinea sp.]